MTAARRSVSAPLRLRILKGQKRPLRILADSRQKMDGLTLLRSLGSSTAKAVFFDPQYRSVLDKQNYGNEGARQKGRAALSSMSDSDISAFLQQISRALAPSGHLFFWVDKFIIGEGLHLKLLVHAPRLRLVDLIFWDKGRPGMGRRSRYCTEVLVIAQREPVRAKGVWTDHGIPDSWFEYADRSVHTHAKPVQLTQRLIRAVTKRGDLVVDPCAGGYGVLDCCIRTGRTFVGCDLI